MTARIVPLRKQERIAAPPETERPTPTFSVGEMAAKIGYPGDPGVIERIKVWTRSGLIFTVDGSKHPGTGRPRQFDWPNLIRGAILNALVNARVEIFAREDTGLALVAAQEAYKQWEREKKPGRYFLVLMAFRGEPGPEGTARYCYICKGRATIKAFAESAIVVDLSQVFARVGRFA
jgi:hypothetical protein